LRAKGSRHGGSSGRIVLSAADNLSGVETAERVFCSEPRGGSVAVPFAERRLAGPDDAPRSGKPPQVPEVSQPGLPSCLVGWR
jgi:hypothetical protein